MLRPVMIDTAPLTRFQRLLMGADGTVTHILEAYADEPVEVVKLHQGVEVATDADLDLRLSADDEVLRRRVLLRGRHSRRPLLYAEATVAIARVERSFLDGLVGTDRPIGLLLAENRTETFREVLVMDREPAGSLGTHFAVEPTAELLFRTYRILSRRRPVMVITEKFPTDFFRGLPA
jgi:chorismate-pyruvate lyase